MNHNDHRYKILVISDYREINSSRPEAEIFVKMSNAGHTIHILSYPEANFFNARFRSNGITVIENHPVKKGSISFIKYLRKIIQKEQYDFVHAFNSLGLTNAVWAMIGLRSKLIAYRGYAGQTHWYDPMMYLKYFHPRVEHIICVSELTRDFLARNMPWAKHKLTTIHKGHDPAWYHNIKPVDRSVLGFQDDDVLICCVANARSFKGIPYLIEALNQIPYEPHIHLLLIGKGYHDEPIHSLVEKSVFAKNIHRLGFRDDSLSIVAACDALVLASTHGEALTKSVIEAMCLEIPPIITDIAGNAGLVIDGISGWVVPPADTHALTFAISDMINHKAERKQRGLNAKKHINQHFHTNNTVEGFIRLYKRLIQ